LILPDVNPLVYALRADAPHHAVSRTWLERVIAGDAIFALSKLTLGALIRITTNRRFYPVASSLDDAFGFCEDLLRQPHCRLVEPGERHWDIFRRLCIETNTRRPDTTDAWYAALAIEWGCEWVTFDRDFLKFPGLKCTILSPSST
jgi:toxin-antitoxin system PIN domain toxin